MADYNSKYSGEQVEALLDKAGTALQAEQYKGTVTGVKINGSTKNPSNGVVDLGTVITSHQDISGKQDKLVSGTNIKTINNQSILGSGNITISGGASSDKVEVVQLQPEIDGDVWIYHIPAGKFVELGTISGATPSYIHFELLDPVEVTSEDEDDRATEYSKYHFTMPWSYSWSFGFGTNTNQNIGPTFLHNDSLTPDTFYAEFDVLCALIHYPASTGYPDILVGYIIAAPLYN